MHKKRLAPPTKEPLPKKTTRVIKPASPQPSQPGRFNIRTAARRAEP